MIKRLCLALYALVMLCIAAQAETTGFLQGRSGAQLGDNYYMVVDEGENDALVRIAADGTPRIALRADELGDMVALDGKLYFLARTGDVWEIMETASQGAYPVYAFSAGKEVSDISAQDGLIFVLIDSRLHVIYLKPGLCVQLSGEQMEEYVLLDDYAYYISSVNRVACEHADDSGNMVKAQPGIVCGLNLSTGKSEVIIPGGADSLQYADDMLYFYNYADCYIMGAGDEAELAGFLYGYDIASGEQVKLADMYDWEFYASEAGVCVLRQGTVEELSGEVRFTVPITAQVVPAGDAFIVFDWENTEFRIEK